MEELFDTGRVTKYLACPACGGQNSAERGGNTSCFHCENGDWVQCVDSPEAMAEYLTEDENG